MCPYCKESIHPEAARCEHCHAERVPSGGCGFGQTTAARIARAVPSVASEGRQRKTLMRAAGQLEHEDGLWCFIEASEHYCIYELGVPAVGPTLPT